ncbi:MAG: response regulator [Deltaproteobacteria bacterium]|nr:response regulator [Deltaproteobacteria bacterium]MBW2016330.1 response regulator [Deltaproteobacteria bacterium]MBW2128915.1 response regulator [Deltaproteobacteria bacterium]MBW2303876.1 response regulator [Deltaproteobacteria bacterium]
MKKVLIVDDSNTARMVIKRCLQIAGLPDAAFFEAGNGREALSLLKKEPVDLVVTDLNMPVMDGETFLRWLKGSPKTHDIPVIMVSSAGNPAKEKEVLALGARAVIGKPVSPGELSRSISDLVEGMGQWGAGTPASPEVWEGSE